MEYYDPKSLDESDVTGNVMDDATRIDMLERALQLSQIQQSGLMNELVEWEKFYNGEKKEFMKHMAKASKALQDAHNVLTEAKKDITDYANLMADVEKVVNSEALVVQAMANGFMAMPSMDRLAGLYKKKKKKV